MTSLRAFDYRTSLFSCRYATSVSAVSSAVELRAPGPRGTPPLLARLVDDAALFPPGSATMPDAVRGHLEGRVGECADVMGLFLCPASRLAELITELIKVKPPKPVALSLVIDTGLGGVPKAVSIVESRSELLALRMVEMPAPSDVDEVWLERVSEFVPEDVIRVVEPRRGGAEWLDGVRRVIEHGSWPKLRCGGLSQENFPSVDEVADFLGRRQRWRRRVQGDGRSAQRRPPHRRADRVHPPRVPQPPRRDGTQPRAAGDVREALASTDAEALAAEAQGAERPGRPGGPGRLRVLRLVLARRARRRSRGAGAAVSWISDPNFTEDQPFGPQTLPYGVDRAGRPVAVRVGDHALPLRDPDALGELAASWCRATRSTSCSAGRPRRGARCGRGSVELVTAAAAPRGAALVPLDDARCAAVHRRRLRGLLQLAATTRRTSAGSSARHRPAAAELDAPADRLPRPRGHGRTCRAPTSSARTASGAAATARSSARRNASTSRPRSGSCAVARCRGGLPTSPAAEHVFGVVLVNDWSARDIQALGVPAARPVPRQVVRHVDLARGSRRSKRSSVARVPTPPLPNKLQDYLVERLSRGAWT